MLVSHLKSKGSLLTSRVVRQHSVPWGCRVCHGSLLPSQPRRMRTSKPAGRGDCTVHDSPQGTCRDFQVPVHQEKEAGQEYMDRDRYGYG